MHTWVLWKMVFQRFAGHHRPYTARILSEEFNSMYICIDCEYLSFFHPAKMYKYSKFIYLARITFNFYIKKNEFI